MKNCIVCIASEFKGNDFFEECGEAGWRKRARLEIADEKNLYKPPKIRKDYAGVALCLAKQDAPDTAHYTEAEIVYRVSKPKHVGLIFASERHERIQ